MSYQVLARTSRPRAFAEVVGQKPIVRTLQNALAQDRVAHALIFSGVRGVGKTTLARIMAKALNCEDRQENEPCNECRSCTEINSGTSVDLIEIDGASNRGIQEIRELKENIRFMPASSPYKIIIIDEVHMLTTEAFNALLKTLEEPPEHVFFMFATTELHKVPVTILSRCQRYELKRVANDELLAHFSRLAEKEGVAIEQAALAIIVREAAGSVRDGLSLLDQVFSYCGSKVTLNDVTDMLGLVNQKVVADIARALLRSDLAGALAQLDRVYEYGMDVRRFINELLAWFRNLVVCSLGKEGVELLDLPDDILALVRETAGENQEADLMLMFSILLEQLEKAGYSSHPRFALELAFIKAVQANEVVPVTTLLGRLDEMIADLPADATAPGGTARSTPASSGKAPAERIQPAPAAEAERGSEGPDRSGAEKKTEQVRDDVKPDSDPVASSAECEGSVSGGAEGEGELRQKSMKKNVRQHWVEFIGYVADRKPWMASALQVASGVHLDDNVLLIQYENPAECRLLKNKENITPLTEFVLDFFQENFRIRFTVPDSTSCDIDPENGKSPIQERQALASDNLVLTAVDIFNGEVGDIRVGPRFRKPLENGEPASKSPETGA